MVMGAAALGGGFRRFVADPIGRAFGNIPEAAQSIVGTPGEKTDPLTGKKFNAIENARKGPQGLPTREEIFREVAETGDDLNFLPKDEQDLYVIKRQLQSIGGDRPLPGRTIADQVKNGRIRLQNLMNVNRATGETRAETQLRAGSNPRVLAEIATLPIQAPFIPGEVVGGLALGQGAKTFSEFTGIGDPETFERVGTLGGQFVGGGLVPKNVVRAADTAGDIAAGLRAAGASRPTGRPIRTRSDTASALGLDFLGEELSDVARLAGTAGRLAARPVAAIPGVRVLGDTKLAQVFQRPEGQILDRINPLYGGEAFAASDDLYDIQKRVQDAKIELSKPNLTEGQKIIQQNIIDEAEKQLPNVSKNINVDTVLVPKGQPQTRATKEAATNTAKEIQRRIVRIEDDLSNPNISAAKKAERQAELEQLQEQLPGTRGISPDVNDVPDVSPLRQIINSQPVQENIRDGNIIFTPAAQADSTYFKKINSFKPNYGSRKIQYTKEPGNENLIKVLYTSSKDRAKRTEATLIAKATLNRMGIPQEFLTDAYIDRMKTILNQTFKDQAAKDLDVVAPKLQDLLQQAEYDIIRPGQFSETIMNNKKNIKKNINATPGQKARLSPEQQKTTYIESNAPNPGGPKDPDNASQKVIDDASDPNVENELIEALEDGVLQDETLGRRLIINLESKLNAATLLIKQSLRNNNKVYEKLGWGKKFQGQRVAVTDEDKRITDVLLRLLHGEARIADDVVQEGLELGTSMVDGRKKYLNNDVRRYLRENNVDENYVDVYNTAWNEVHVEELKRFDFDPKLAENAEDYYISRGWKPSKEFLEEAKKANQNVDAYFQNKAKSNFGRRPGFTDERNMYSYDDMRQLGFEPLSWNIFQQIAISNGKGENFRFQQFLKDALKRYELTKSRRYEIDPVDREPEIETGFRIPNLPGFKGKPIRTEDGKTIMVDSWIVESEIANKIEQIFKVESQIPNIKVKYLDNIDVNKYVDNAVFVPKRAKLLASVFQDVDFLGRSLIGSIGAFVDAFTRGILGEPSQFKLALNAAYDVPRSFYGIANVRIRNAARNGIKDALLDDTKDVLGKYYTGKEQPKWMKYQGKDREPITFRDILKGGLNIEDRTIFAGKEFDKLISEVVEETNVLKKFPKLGKQTLGNLERWSRDGLFNGVYPFAIKTEIERVIPQIISSNPNYTNQQVISAATNFVNMKYSSIPASQSRIHNQPVRWFLTRWMFSLGESEGIIRQQIRGLKALLTLGPEMAIRTTGRLTGKKLNDKKFTEMINKIPGVGKVSDENSRLYATNIIGQYLFLILTANAIHYASTGKPLPKDRYSPVSKTSWGPLPIGYNTRFASPDIPGLGKDGTSASLDLVGQLDTAIRILDPFSWVEGRVSVPVGAFLSQVKGENFFGEKISNAGPFAVFGRGYQALQDTLTPISLQEPIEEYLVRNMPGFNLGPVSIPSGEEIIGDRQSTRLSNTGNIIDSAGFNLRGNYTRDIRNNAAAKFYKKEYDELSTIEKDKIKRDPEFKETLLEIESGKAARGNNYSKYILTREKKETITANNVKYYTDELVRKLLNPEEIHREGKRDFGKVKYLIQEFVDNLYDEKDDEYIALQEYRINNDIGNYTGDESTLPDDIMLNEYYAIIDNHLISPKRTKDPRNVYDWTAIGEERDKFEESLPPDQKLKLNNWKNRRQYLDNGAEDLLIAINKNKYKLKDLYGIDANQGLHSLLLKLIRRPVADGGLGYTDEQLRAVATKQKSDYTYKGEEIQDRE